ncbi:MAG: phosphomannomutase/phosphoglucomutase, partial [Candidatus Nanopelagicales bacterium]|nr:phosphomannomutase/phosphoglucomutase [Candidatus Nanopelagicales bacterium]
MSQEITLDRLQKLIKAYDVRGIVPGELDENISFQIGQAFVVALKLRKSEGGCGQVVIAHDMRPSGPALVQSFANGIKAQGVDVLHMGLASTDGLYFATGFLNIAGAMFTASHNPAQYNGIKLAKAGAAPVGQDSGLKEITQLVLKGVSPYEGVKGKDSERDLNSEYVKYLHSLVDLKAVRKLKVVIDAGNGMGGFSVPKVFDNSNIEIVPMYFELDGTFPNHEANPIEPANLVDLQKRVVAEKADLGIAFDGDADRAFFVDENGVSISPSAITALIAKRELKREPGSVIIHNLITSRSVAEVVSENGGTAIKTRVGHSFIKQVMKDTNAIFGGEHSGHFYFRDFWFADSGMLAALHVLSALGETKSGETFSALIKEFDRYIASGEINTRVKDVLVTSNKVRQHFASMKDVQTDDLDGLTFASDAWWVNIRPSNTEPLLRLNAEAKDRATMEKLRDEVLVIIRKDQQ